MLFLSLAVVVIMGFGPGEAVFWVGFPERTAGVGAAHQCLKSGVGSHQVTYGDIKTDDGRFFHRVLVSSLEWAESGHSKSFPGDTESQAHCALVISAAGYNSFVHNATHCIGHTYQAKRCNVGPKADETKNTGDFVEIFVGNSQSANSTLPPYVPDIFEFHWKNSTDLFTLLAEFEIHGLYADVPVTHIIVRMANGTELTLTDLSTPMELPIFLDGDCTDQDLTIILMHDDEILNTQTFPRDICPAGARDTCNGCIALPDSSRSAADQKLSYRSLEEGCKKYKDHSVPIVTSELRRDQILSYLESDMDVSPDSFWVAFSRSAGSSSFTWPDGSTDLSMFGNGKTFTPRSGEDCASAYVDVVSMELMIDSVSCIQQRSGFCVR